MRLNRVMILFAAMMVCCTDEHPVPVLPPAEQVYTCAWNGTDQFTYLDSISCPEEFGGLAGSPLVPALSDVRSVKVIYEISTGRIHFPSSGKYLLHYDFCHEVLGYPKSPEQFNSVAYWDGSDRLFYCASLNYYRSADVFTLEISPADHIDAEGIRTIFFAARNNVFFGNRLCLFAGSGTLKVVTAPLTDIPKVGEDALYGAQKYQALNCAGAFGYLKKMNIEAIASEPVGRHDIVVVNGLPIGIPVIAGIVTTVFQTPLSHVNVLSHNRGTPNLAYKDAWNDTVFTRLFGKLVYFAVTADSFVIREAGITEAESFWQNGEPHEPMALECHDDTAGLFPLSALSSGSLHLVGAKAANLAQCAKIAVEGRPVSIPECAFALPFYYYRRHMAKNNLDKELDDLLDDPRCAVDAVFRMDRLTKLRKRIVEAPLDEKLVDTICAYIAGNGAYPEIRFRSSTNVEDIEGFNGAGLYESATGEVAGDKRKISEAIKDVYASLWTLRGFEEREFFKIDQRSCAMGILAHRSFPDEQANGVAVTANIYQPYVPAFTINVQIKDISVVLPPAGFLSDQVLLYTLYDDWLEHPNICYIAHSNVNFGEPVLQTGELIELAKSLNAIKEEFYTLKQASDYYKFAMDVEFKFDGAERKLYIKQARPYEIK